MSDMIAGSLQLEVRPTAPWLQDLHEGCTVTVNSYVGHVQTITRGQDVIYIDITIAPQRRPYAPDHSCSLEAIHQQGEEQITLLLKLLEASQDEQDDEDHYTRSAPEEDR